MLTEPEPGWTEAREAVWQEMRTVIPLESMRYASRVDLSMRFHTAQGTRHLTRVEGGWGVSEYRNSIALETIKDGSLRAWVCKHGVTP